MAPSESLIGLLEDTPADASSDIAALPGQWHAVSRRWGHPLHSICSYFAMFPPRLARVLIQWLSDPGDAVWDPFSGRGTAALESLLLGRVSYASDASPLAHVLSRAKTFIPGQGDIGARLAQLRTFCADSHVDLESVPHHIRMLYSDTTLTQLSFLRGNLRKESVVDNFIVAMVLGMLHANHSKKGATRGFSVSMPNTFSMAPDYVEKYIAAHGLQAPNVDVFDMLLTRMRQLLLPNSEVAAGEAWRQDAVQPPPEWLTERKVRLVLTSPPYLQVIKYGKYNWIRLWFLQEDPQQVDDQLMATSSVARYVTFMQQVSQRIGSVMQPDGLVCFIIGDVRRNTEKGETSLNLAKIVWEQAIQPLGWHLHGIIADVIPEGHKVSRIWKNNSGRATKIDRLLIVSPTEIQLPPLSDTDWSIPELGGES